MRFAWSAVGLTLLAAVIESSFPQARGLTHTHSSPAIRYSGWEAWEGMGTAHMEGCVTKRLICESFQPLASPPCRRRLNQYSFLNTGKQHGRKEVRGPNKDAWVLLDKATVQPGPERV